MEKNKKIFIGAGILILLVGIFGSFLVLGETQFISDLTPDFLTGFVSAQSEDVNDSRLIGYEFLDDGEVVHIWNNATISDYYFEKDSGIQLTNHYDDYWTTNVFCLGYYDGGEWNKIKCADELIDFTRTIDTDDLTYVNATLWKDIVYNGYDFRFGVNYYLGLNDENLTVTIYGKNIDDEDIPVDIGFAWKVKDIDVPFTETSDEIMINGSKYSLNESGDFIFKNMTVKQTNGDWNFSCLEICTEFYTQFQNECDVCILNQSSNYKSLPFFKLYDYGLGLDGKENFLRLDWNENLDYKVKLYTEENQSNSYVALIINAGRFDSGVSKSTKLYWVDALIDNMQFYFKADDNAANTNVDDATETADGTASVNTNTLSVAGLMGAGDALFFEGTEYADTNFQILDMSADKTLNFWIKTSDGDAHIIGAVAGGGYFFSVMQGGGNIWWHQTASSGHIGIVSDVGGWHDGDPHMITLVQEANSGAGLLMYIDGSLADTTIEDNSALSANALGETLFMAAYNNGGSPSGYLTSTYDGVSFWTRAITSEEVTALWNSGDGFDYPFTTDTCTYSSGNWDVACSDNCTVDSITDLGGNNLTLIGTGVFSMNSQIKNFNKVFIYDLCDVALYSGGNFTGITNSPVQKCYMGYGTNVAVQPTLVNVSYVDANRASSIKYDMKIKDESGAADPSVLWAGGTNPNVNTSLHGPVYDSNTMISGVDGKVLMEIFCKVKEVPNDGYINVSLYEVDSSNSIVHTFFEGDATPCGISEEFQYLNVTIAQKTVSAGNHMRWDIIADPRDGEADFEIKTKFGEYRLAGGTPPTDFTNAYCDSFPTNNDIKSWVSIVWEDEESG